MLSRRVTQPLSQPRQVESYRVKETRREPSFSSSFLLFLHRYNRALQSMDPLSITNAVTGLVGVCLKTAVQLDGLRSRYKNAGVVIAALCSETTVISAGLTQMQTLLAQNIQVRNRKDLLTTFDTTLTGCLVVFTCLEQETERLALAGSRGQPKLTWSLKARSVWNDKKMKDYLSLVRGQQASLSFFIQLLRMQSTDDMYQQVKDQGNILKKQAARTESLRKANPSIDIPKSLLGAWHAPEGEGGDLIDLSESTPYPASAQTSPDLREKRLLLPNTALNTDPVPEPPDWRPSPDVEPLELSLQELPFERPLARSQHVRLVLRNPNPGRVIFKVMTTAKAPIQYCVRPNYGSIDAGQTAEVMFEMMALKEEPPAGLVSKDKFLIQSMAAAQGRDFVSCRMVSDAIRNTKTPEAIQDKNDSRDPNTFVQGKKMRVVFLPAK
jgi:hypothetical protein